jgi:hypothetical protein
MGVKAIRKGDALLHACNSTVASWVYSIKS